MPAPKNNNGHKSEKIWRDAIMRAVKRQAEGKNTKYLETLANKLVKEGAAGNVTALKEIGDRLDGKPAQVIVGDSEQPVQMIQRVILGSQDTNS